jgi:acetyl-CoA carboxylase biotin carboxyl carrier protein
MPGTFYLAPSPDDPPFVKVGDPVKKGQTLCIIEAMKIMNEIESELDGVITQILVDDSGAVEFNQPLFIINPS